MANTRYLLEKIRSTLVPAQPLARLSRFPPSSILFLVSFPSRCLSDQKSGHSDLLTSLELGQVALLPLTFH